MEIDRFQVDAALHCPQKRRERRERNLPVIKAGHYLAINTPELFLRAETISSGMVRLSRRLPGDALTHMM